MSATPNPSRQIRGVLISSSRSEAVFGKVRPSRLSPAQANGIRYERRVQRALTSLAKTFRGKFEPNPWFRFHDSNGPGACSPDGILWLDNDLAVIVEVKYTWTPVAGEKLKTLYLPVVGYALAPFTPYALVICKVLTPDAPRPVSRLSEVARTNGTVPVYQWLGNGGLVW